MFIDSKNGHPHLTYSEFSLIPPKGDVATNSKIYDVTCNLSLLL